MNIENLIICLWKNGQATVKPYDYKFIESIGTKLSYDQEGLTEKQANLARKILKKNITVLNNEYRKDVTNYIDNPTYKYPIRFIDSARKINLIKENGKNTKIILKFPYDEDIITLIRTRKKFFFDSIWNSDEKNWEFSFQHEVIRFCKELVDLYKFDYDLEFQVFFDQINE
jgi:hypothetical protein